MHGQADTGGQGQTLMERGGLALAHGHFRLEPGEPVEHYEIIRELGRGGMGVVYLARDTQLGRRVAIKFLAPLYAAESERFLREARATAQCEHENIVVIHAVNRRVDGVPYMVLEYLEGSSLQQQLEQRIFSATKAIEMILPVVRALVHAHAAGIVHRDLKPANVFITRTGVIKVLDFGIATALCEAEVTAADTVSGLPSIEHDGPLHTLGSYKTGSGLEVGTPGWMAPEQWGLDTVDVRTDIWGVGLTLYKMVTGSTPLEGLSREQLRREAYDLDTPLVSVAQVVPNLSGPFAALVDRCLCKRKPERFADSSELLAAIETLLPARQGRSLRSDECPYPGLAAFEASDADRYFGRAQEIRRAVAAIDDRPLLAVVGPSGVGKSSFVRAGVIPALRSSGEAWETVTLRPGRHPLNNLAELWTRVTGASDGQSADDLEVAGPTFGPHDRLAERLRAQPGLLGARLRARARRRDTRILLVLDQFEELYTLVADARERQAFASCITALVDDPASPLRVVLAMRSDFLGRLAEHEGLSDEVTSGLMLLPPIGRQGLRLGLIQPAQSVGYRFEDEAMVTAMLDVLEAAPGALPLLQFAVSRLWETRDEERRVLTRTGYDVMGGVEGALAAHADATVAELGPAAQSLARQIFARLVTPERTRGIVSLSELEELAQPGQDVAGLVRQLVKTRLLVSDIRGAGADPVVELVHESLITGWPTLHRWLDETEEDALLRAQLRDVARQWEFRGQPHGLLWRGEALDDARRFLARYPGELSTREQEYIEAAVRLATRAARLRRAIMTGALVLLTCLVVGTTIALVQIRRAEQVALDAERTARASEETAREQARLAQQQAQRARAAQDRINEQLELLRAEEQARKTAESMARNAAADLGRSHAELEASNAELQRALRRAEQATKAALAASAAQRALSERLEALLEQERQRVHELERKRGKIIDELR